MMQLPHEMRDSLVEQLDEYIDAQAGSPEPELVANFVIELLGTLAEDMKVDDADEIILKMESSGELEAGLQEILEEEFESNDEMEYTGEEITSILEKICDLEWSTKDDEDELTEDEDEDDPDGFFDDMGAEEDDE